MVREIAENELNNLLELYLYLHEKAVPEVTEHLMSTWETIIKDENHHIIVNEIDNRIVSSCVCVIIPNLTRNIRPYAFIENVVTHIDHRGRGYATECLNYAKKIAEETNCYKMMLLTGSKEEVTLDLYRNAGYNSADKRHLYNGLNEFAGIRTRWDRWKYYLDGGTGYGSLRYDRVGNRTVKIEEICDRGCRKYVQKLGL